MNVAIVGYGIMGGLHHAACKQHPKARVTAVVNRGEAKREAAAKQGVKGLHATVAEMLGKERPDLVIVALPDRLHRDAVVACAEAGCAVLVEKPFATTVEDAVAMARAAKKSGARIAANFTFRCEPDYAFLRAQVEGGQFGKLKQLKIRVSNKITVPTEMISWGSQSSPTEFLMPHSIDLARWWTGEEVVSLRAFPVDGVLRARGIDSHDAMTVVATMSGGTQLILESSWILPPGFPTLVDFCTELQGSEGAARLDRNETGISMFASQHERPINWLSFDSRGKGLGFFFESMARKLDWFAGDGPPETGVDDALVNTAVLEAILGAARSGDEARPVSRDELIERSMP
jgi:predicted dehydrogenase